MKKLFLFLSLISSTPLLSEIKQANELFSSWITEQSYYQRCLADIQNKDIKVDQSSLAFAEHTGPFKTQLLNIAGNKNGNLDAKKITSMRRLAATSTSDFLTRLQKAGIAGNSVNALDNDNDFQDVVARYVGLFNTLFADQTKQSSKREFGIANRFFEFCFSPKTFPRFCTMMQQEETKPLGRFLYASLWQKLAGTGWIYWHEDTLKRLKHAAKKGKTIVYVAGGSDIYQLMANGIYNLRIIDPYLQGSQDKYYAHAWQWLLRGEGDTYGQGDELHFSFPEKQVTMKRAQVTPGELFSTSIATGDQITVPADTVTWDVFENDTRKGRITFERRQAELKDFVLKKNEELLMSFNELYFVALPGKLHGWGIGAHQLPDNLKIHVKQLRKPITKKIAENLVWADEQQLSYINLGSAVR